MIEAHHDVHALGWASKELHYFDRLGSDPLSPGEVAAYHDHFRRPSTKQCGEWTPRYMFDPWTPAHLHQGAPDAKLLVLLRDPVARFESGLNHDIGRGVTEPIARSVAFQRGLYHQQLERLLDHFRRDQVLILQFECCVEQPGPMLDRTFRFLGLAPERVPRHLIRPAVNRRRGPPLKLSDGQRAALRDDYEDDVRRLLVAFPELDVYRWPNFCHLR
jgi:Sulfotransferase domain